MAFTTLSFKQVEKMENLLSESGEQVCDPEICKKLAKMFTLVCTLGKVTVLFKTNQTDLYMHVL